MITQIANVEGLVLPIVAVVSFLIVVIVAFSTTKNRKLLANLLPKEPIQTEKAPEKKTEEIAIPSEASTTVEDVEKIKVELRVMEVEKEIVAYALTRLYEAETEGKITDKDRKLLLTKYSEEMKHLDKGIETKQMIVKLHELEATKTDLVDMLHGKIDEINKNIEKIRVTLGIQPTESIKAKTQVPQNVEPPLEKTKKEEEKTPPKVKVKSVTEERIETIQEEVLKVLERLEQIETEE